MVRVMVVALLFLLVPVRSVDAGGMYKIEDYRGWAVEYRVGYVMGMLDTAYVMTAEYYPEGHEWSKTCFRKKGIYSWAVEIDEMLMGYDPGGAYDVKNMSVPEYVQWALEHLCG